MEMTLSENTRSFRGQRSLTRRQPADGPGAASGAAKKRADKARHTLPASPALARGCAEVRRMFLGEGGRPAEIRGEGRK